MSTIDEKAQEVSKESAAEADDKSHPEAVNKKKSDGAPILLFLIFGLAAGSIFGWIIFPELLYSQKKQPIDFNHQLHNELVDDGCQSCHFLREDGSYAGVPKLEQCIDCHEETQGEDPEEAKFVEQYVEMEKEVPWLIYSRQPDCVFFSHAAHLKAPGIDCVTCHGHIGESTHLKPYEENRLTGYSRDIWGKNIAGLKRNPWDRMKMDDCAECHAEAAGSGREGDTKGTIDRHFKEEIVRVAFWGEKNTAKGSSVQTQKDACFVCHK
jgi:menaquinone reductase, multiheme cytochrome c subunit